jgi:tRNA modification GTPase
MIDSDTIAAISTAPGMGAIGILRLSGKKTLSIASKLLSKKNKPVSKDYILENKRKTIFCNFVDYAVNGHVLDKIIFIFSESPNSFTGEDLAEFHFHGNPILLREALELFYREGARPARPGEFTRRAFLNGKMDLTEAEAIGRLIHSRSRFELELAQKNFFGEISKLTSKLRSEMVGIKAECEAEIDFSTEDLTYESLEQRRTRISRIRTLCESVLQKSERADILIGRSKVVLFGEPNVGKSSLMNRLLGRERSIISDTPGTTRDYITEDINIAGIPIQLVDTAGLRDTDDAIERLGIEQSKREAGIADLKLYLVDTSLSIDWKEFIDKNHSYLESSILIANKIDQKNSNYESSIFRNKYPNMQIMEVSCKTGEGIEDLISLIENSLSGSESSDEYIILEDRQKFHFQAIVRALARAEELMIASAPAEIVIKEIDDAVAQIGEVNGVITTEEVLGRIFSTFCVGK